LFAAWWACLFSVVGFWPFGSMENPTARGIAMSVWLRYREHEVDVPGVRTKDMSTIVFGAFINF